MIRPKILTGLLAPALTLALAACVPVAEPPPPPPPPPPLTEACGAEGLPGLVGQSRSVLQTMKFAGPVRIIEPGMAVTMDYSAGRLNIWIAEDGMIDSVTCG